MKTTVWHIAKLAWALYWHRGRGDLRIGQMLWDWSVVPSKDPFYAENEPLIKGIMKWRR